VKRSLIVFGAGGHGKVVADILLAQGLDVAGFVDDQRAVGSRVLGLPVLGPTEWLRNTAADVALGIGDNAARALVYERCLELGAHVVTVIHPRAVVAASARVEDGAVVMALAVLNADALVERGAIINTGAIVEHDCKVGPFAHISPNATMGGGCTIDCHAQLGVGATMLPGTSVGARSIVGGGAMVTRSIAADSVARGVPARRSRGIS
jgi:sugar O-acyltransferase (sialic acid O-acetyltransferase NeuD family)